jgi:hypothetical protein
MINFTERILPNKKFRYELNYHSIYVCIDSVQKRTEEEIEEFLNNCSIKYLINNEGYIINL